MMLRRIVCGRRIDATVGDMWWRRNGSEHSVRRNASIWRLSVEGDVSNLCGHADGGLDN